MNPQSPADHYNGPVTWMDRSNQYMLNELWLYAGKAANNDGEGLALGFRTDFLYGASARLTTSAGLEDHINKGGENMGLAIPNLYIDAAYNDLRMKIGHFISPVGYYTVGTYQNFFNTIPYTYQWGEPFTHTGILPAYQVTDNLVIGTGFTRAGTTARTSTRTWATSAPPPTANLLKEGDSLAYVQMYSEEPDGATTGAGQAALPQYTSKPQFAGRYFQTLVYSRPLSDKWTYVAQSDFGYQSNAVTAPLALNSAGCSQQRSRSLVRHEPVHLLQAQQPMVVGFQLRVVPRRGRLPRRRLLAGLPEHDQRWCVSNARLGFQQRDRALMPVALRAASTK